MADPNHEYLTMAEREELQLLKRGYLEPTIIPNGLAGGRTLRNKRSCDPRINEHRFDGRGNLRDTVKNLDHDGDRHYCKLFLLLKATQETEDIIFSMNDDGVVEVEFCNVDDGLTSRSDMVALIKKVKATWEEDADWHRENKAAAAATITRWVARHHRLMFLKKAAAATISRWAARHYRWKALKRKAAAAATISRWAARHYRLRALKMTAGLDVEASSTGIPLEDSPSPVRIDGIETPPVAIKEPTVVQDVPSMPRRSTMMLPISSPSRTVLTFLRLSRVTLHPSLQGQITPTESTSPWILGTTVSLSCLLIEMLRFLLLASHLRILRRLSKLAVGSLHLSPTRNLRSSKMFHPSFRRSTMVLPISSLSRAVLTFLRLSRVTLHPSLQGQTTPTRSTSPWILGTTVSQSCLLIAMLRLLLPASHLRILRRLSKLAVWSLHLSPTRKLRSSKMFHQGLRSHLWPWKLPLASSRKI